MPWSDPAKRAEYKAKWYTENAQRHKTNVARNNVAYRIRNREAIREHLLTHPCVDCGLADPDLLEFDHVTGTKRLEISRMARTSYSTEALMAEIAKCEVRCANCHRKVTVQRRTA